MPQRRGGKTGRMIPYEEAKELAKKRKRKRRLERENALDEARRKATELTDAARKQLKVDND